MLLNVALLRLVVCALFVTSACSASPESSSKQSNVVLTHAGEIRAQAIQEHEGNKLIRREVGGELAQVASDGLDLDATNSSGASGASSSVSSNYNNNKNNSVNMSADAGVIDDGRLNASTNISLIPMKMPTWTQVQESTANAHFLVFWGQPLLISVFFMMTQHSESIIKSMTWRVLSGSVSLGCTALLFQAFKMFWYLIFGLTEVSLGIHAAIDVGKLVFLMWLMPRMMKACWNRPLAREVFTIMGAHFIGFASIQCAQSLLTRSPFWNSPGLYWCGLLIMVCLNIALMVFNRSYRYGLLKLWREDEVAWRPWMDQCDHVENEAAGLLAGFLVSTNVRFAIVGVLPGAPGYPHYNTAMQIDTMLLVAVPSACLAFFVMLTVRGFKSGLELRPLFRRITDTGKACVVLSAGWLFFFFVQWQSYYMELSPGVYATQSDNMAASMMSIIIAVFLVALLITVYGNLAGRIAWLRDDGLMRDITMVFVLMVGFSWETTMSIAVQSVAGEINTNRNGDFMFIFLMILVNVCFLPVWCFYILPNTVSENEKGSAAASADEEKLPLLSQGSSISREDASSRRVRSSAARAKGGMSDVSEEKCASEKSAAEDAPVTLSGETLAPPTESVASSASRPSRRAAARSARGGQEGEETGEAAAATHVATPVATPAAPPTQITTSRSAAKSTKAEATPATGDDEEY